MGAPLAGIAMMMCPVLCQGPRKTVNLAGLGSWFPWDAHAQTITSLSLDVGRSYPNRSAQPIISTTQYSFDDILTALHAMPKLETLSVFHVLPLCYTNANPTRSSVPLPHLRSLELVSFDGCAAAMWSLLDTPPDACVSIVCRLFVSVAARSALNFCRSVWASRRLQHFVDARAVRGTVAGVNAQHLPRSEGCRISALMTLAQP